MSETPRDFTQETAETKVSSYTIQRNGFQAINSNTITRIDSSPEQSQNATLPNTPPSGSSEVLSPKEKKGKGMSRLLPCENNPLGGKLHSAAERFCWNIGYWLLHRLGKAENRNYKAAETLAQGLLEVPDTPRGLHRWEAEYIDEVGLNPGIFRSLRARIFIGCALVYEHNLRGHYLNHAGQTHEACRPTLDKKYAHVNTGRSQAQMFVYGSDVSKASPIFAVIKRNGYLPSDDLLLAHKENFTNALVSNQVIDDCFFPATARRALYLELMQWHIGQNLPRSLWFAIPAYTVYDHPYLSTATVKQIPPQQSHETTRPHDVVMSG